MNFCKSDTRNMFFRVVIGEGIEIEAGINVFFSFFFRETNRKLKSFEVEVE